jgi:uncharacterized Fe-S cluster protein YjdI/CDGSH-type Zn-finger protein
MKAMPAADRRKFMSETNAGPHLGRKYSGAGIDVYYDARRCRHFGECVRGLSQVFDPAKRPWIQADNASAQEIADVIRRCPSGALQYIATTVPAEEPDRPTAVDVDEAGMIRLRGDIQWRGPDGELSRETRLTLCGCGLSERRPYCDANCEHREQSTP